MCTYYYLHYHHVAPCTRGVDYTVQYSFCEKATLEILSETNPLGASTFNTRSSRNGHNQGHVCGHGSYQHQNQDQDQQWQYPYHEHQQQQQQQQQELVQQPCDNLSHAPEYDPVMGIDFTNPCATGGCLVSQHCASGGCRLDDLGGRWVCCRCSSGGNTFRWCVHPMRKVPDALCYHVVCRDCRMDA
ncbi:hypothetical protein GGS20DRAFT_81638 [Poronia punctata]|nr:hypothetical protein GGS20DRAFT_81638 [Poronia punctata]